MTAKRLVPAVLALTVSGATAAFAAAGGPTIRVNHACYQLAQKAALHGSGFAPTAGWSASLDGAKFGHGTTTSKGTITAVFGVPGHLRRGSSGEDSYRLIVRQGTHTAMATFLVTQLSARFSPTSGDPATLKVRFQLLGWGRGGALFLHYVNSTGTDRFDRYLGRPQGACGHHTISHVMLFPFAPKTGIWTFQFDKNPAYKPTSVPRVLIRFRIT